jgi:hypothetical protein
MKEASTKSFYDKFPLEASITSFWILHQKKFEGFFLFNKNVEIIVEEHAHLL